jgi:hypothetical protein
MDFSPRLVLQKTKNSASEHGFSVTYRNAQLYVNIGGTLHPHAYPYYYSMSFDSLSSQLKKKF